jgi:hypothetical protein
VRCTIGRLGVQRLVDQIGDSFVVDASRLAGTKLVVQAV